MIAGQEHLSVSVMGDLASSPHDHCPNAVQLLSTDGNKEVRIHLCSKLVFSQMDFDVGKNPQLKLEQIETGHHSIRATHSVDIIQESANHFLTPCSFERGVLTEGEQRWPFPLRDVVEPTWSCWASKSGASGRKRRNTLFLSWPLSRQEERPT